MHDARVVFRYDTSTAAALVAAAVSREVGEIDDDRSQADVYHEGREVSVEIIADDLVALRAGLNTWGTLLEVAEQMVEVGRRSPSDT